MNYEIVELQEKWLLGLNTKTCNSAPDMSAKIGGLWTRLFGEGLFNKIPHKTNACSICLYSDYETDVNGAYEVTVGCEVSTSAATLENMIIKKIPAGRYAKFVIEGDPQKAVGDFWVKLWQMKLPRSYTGDFEEYHPSENPQNSTIIIYIALQ